MKKIFIFLLIIFSFVFITCEENQGNTTLTITNNSDYSFLNVNLLWNWSNHRANKGIYDFGSINSKSSNTVELNESGFDGGDPSGTISFHLMSTSGNIIICNVKIIIKSYGNNYTFDNNTIVNHSSNKNNFIFELGGPPRKAAFTINNLTDYVFLNVEYDSVDFGNITQGNDSKRNVSAGTKYIYFSFQTKNGIILRCRTEPFTCEDGNNSIVFINNTTATIVGTDKSNTIRNLYDGLN